MIVLLYAGDELGSAWGGWVRVGVGRGLWMLDDGCWMLDDG